MALDAKEALQNVSTFINRIVKLVETVRFNKRRACTMGKRLSALQRALDSASTLSTDTLNRLLEILQDAERLLKEVQNSGRLKHFLRSSCWSNELRRVNQAISECVVDLNLDVAVLERKCVEERDNEDMQLDLLELCQTTSSQLEKDLAESKLTIESLKTTLREVEKQQTVRSLHASKQWRIEERDLSPSPSGPIPEEAVLGRGGCAVVYSGMWKFSPVAVKLLPLRKGVDVSTEVKVVAPLWNPASLNVVLQIMMNARHTNVLTLYGACLTSDCKTLALVLERMESSLYDRLHAAQNGQGLNRLRIAKEIALAMLHLHDQGVLHCDLKSANVLLDSQGHVRVCDFGLARLEAKSGGSPQWVAPEVARGEPPSAASDVYSFGVVLWELATRQVPFAGLNCELVLSRLKRGVGVDLSAVPSDCPVWLGSTLRRCLAGSVEARPSFDELAEKLYSTEQTTQEDGGNSKVEAASPAAAVEGTAPRECESKERWQTKDIEFELGCDYFLGRGVQKDRQKAVYLFRKAAAQGHASAQVKLGLCYENGDGVKKNFREAMSCFQKAAVQGHANAQFNLGVFYNRGLGVKKDMRQAIFWYEKAAAQGHANAQFNLGVCQRDVEYDLRQAVRWYQKAAAQGHPGAQFNLGVCYENGRGVEKDLRQAVFWYQKAAAQGDAKAQFNLGLCFESGDGIGADLQQAVSWYQKAAAQGLASSQYNLGVCFGNGEGVEKDLRQAVFWFQKSAAQGDLDAQFSLGACHERGRGVEKDLRQAASWYKKAAAQGHADAQFNLGACYENGRGVEKDLQQAVSWYQKAAAQGLATSQYNLGACFGNGDGVEKDLRQAVFWFRKAAFQGDTDSQFALGACYHQGNGVEKDLKQAIYWYRKAAAQGDTRAQVNLGVCYHDADGVEKDLRQAVLWFRKAAAQGNANAQQALESLRKSKAVPL